MSGNRTPDLSTIFRKAIAVAAAGLRVMEPAKVISYNEENQTATVLSLFKEADSTTEDAKELPQLIECPVWHLRVGLAAIYLPIRPGDKVALLFADKSLDNWQDSEGENPIDPQDTRTHDLTDALVIPGMYGPNDPIPNVDPADIRIVLYDTDGNVRSQFYLGGNTGDIVSLPENLIMLGDSLEANTEFTSMGETLKTFLQGLTDKIDANNIAINATWVLLTSHIHPVTTAPGSTGVSPTLSTLTGMVNPDNPENDLLATKVKVK